MASEMKALLKQMDQLKKAEAKLAAAIEVAKKQEAAGVIQRIKEAIKHYGFTPEDLFGEDKPKRAGRPKGSGKPKAAKKSSPPKYGDDQGHTWTGRGKRPRWFVAALEAGKKPEDMLIAKPA